MNKAKYRFIGILLFCTLLGLVIVTPATSTAPSWVSEGKYAKYGGGFNIEIGTAGRPGYIKFQVTVGCNWTVGTVTTDARITGGWNISILLNFNNTPLFIGSFGTSGYEMVRLSDSVITTGGGLDFFGMEVVGHPTVLWVENPSALPPANISIGGRGTRAATATASLPMFNATIPVTRYYDSETGALMGFNIAVNITAFGGFGPAPPSPAPIIIGSVNGMGDVGANQIPGLTGFDIISFPVLVTSTNIFPFAWTVGGDPTLWLIAAGVLLGVSALFGAVIYSRKR